MSLFSLLRASTGRFPRFDLDSAQVNAEEARRSSLPPTASFVRVATNQQCPISLVILKIPFSFLVQYLPERPNPISSYRAFSTSKLCRKRGEPPGQIVSFSLETLLSASSISRSYSVLFFPLFLLSCTLRGNLPTINPNKFLFSDHEASRPLMVTSDDRNSLDTDHRSHVWTMSSSLSQRGESLWP